MAIGSAGALGIGKETSRKGTHASQRKQFRLREGNGALEIPGRKPEPQRLIPENPVRAGVAGPVCLGPRVGLLSPSRALRDQLEEAILNTTVTWPTQYDVGLLLIGIAVAVLFGLCMYAVGWLIGPKEPTDGGE